MSRYGATKGIVLVKRDMMKNDKVIHIFSNDLGRIALLAKGIRSITSKRLSHLESGNYIKLSFYTAQNYLYLQETELIYGYSKIRSAPSKIQYLYKLLFILNQILPENQNEPHIFKATLNFLKEMNNKETFRENDFDLYLTDILINGGYINLETTKNEFFNPSHFIEELIGKKLFIPLI